MTLVNDDAWPLPSVTEKLPVEAKQVFLKGLRDHYRRANGLFSGTPARFSAIHSAG